MLLGALSPRSTGQPVLRPLAAVDPGHRDELAAVLESLVGLLWRLGDPDGSRAAAREARTLG